MKTTLSVVLLFLLSLPCLASVTGEVAGDTAAVNCKSDDALAGCLTPKFAMEYYADQGVKYFQTMQSNIPLKVQPKYADLVIRYEWPPWLLLTGYTKSGLIVTDAFLKMTPTHYDKMDCRGFDVQPFCRCHVIFNYSGETVPIYEEFTFNNQGEITFIEAWSDYPSLLPMGPGNDSIWDEQEYWAMKGANRLTAKIPGLGNAEGRINVNSAAMINAALNDTLIADMLHRLGHPMFTWMKQLMTHSTELKSGLSVPVGDVYPYYKP